MKPQLKSPGAKRLKLQYDGPLSSFAFNSKLRRYIEEDIRKELLEKQEREHRREQRQGAAASCPARRLIRHIVLPQFVGCSTTGCRLIMHRVRQTT
jgi:hypothetical protein